MPAQIYLVNRCSVACATVMLAPAAIEQSNAARITGSIPIMGVVLTRHRTRNTNPR